MNRTLLRYFGGKWKLAEKIIQYFPAHQVYVEPFGGGGSVLLKKARSGGEVYNDLDGEIVNLFRVVRDCGAELVRALKLTPYSRDEYLKSYELCEDEVERARRTVVKSFMGFGTDGIFAISGFRSCSSLGNVPAKSWATYPVHLERIIKRLQGVIIENRDAKEVMLQHDSPYALHYVDPPYPHSTRSGHRYRYEMNEEDHRVLAAFLKKLKGAVIVSSYPCELYETLYSGWEKVEINTFADGARARVEQIFLSPAAQKRRDFFGPLLRDIRHAV